MQLKRIKFGGFVLIVMFCALIFTQPVQAADTYAITRYQVNVDIQPDGSAQVEQKTVFDIQDTIRGMYINQNLQTNVGQSKKLVNPQVAVNGQPFSQSEANTEGTFSLTDAQQHYRFKLYQSAQNGDQLAVTLKYQLQNLVINYRDTAELNWKVIGDAWDSDLQNVQIVIQLPAKLKKADLKSWTHGNLDGHQVVEPDKGRVTIQLANNPAHQFVESHIIFPTAVTAENANKIDKPRQAAIIKQETRLAQQANQNRQAQQRRYWLLSVMAVLLAPVLFVLIFRKVRKTLPVITYTGQAPEHVYDLPDKNGPAVVRQLLALPITEQARTESLSATILDLVARKNLTIDVQEPTKKRFHKKTPQFSLTLMTRNQLSHSEQKLITWLFDVIGDGQHVRLFEIEQYPKRHSATLFNQYYHGWQAAVTTEVNRSGWLREHIAELMTSLNYWLIGLGGLILILICGALIELVAWWTLIPMGLVFLLTLWRKFHLQLWTQLGYEKRGEWLGFKQMLKDISTLDMANVPDVLLWDRYLSYATAFGIADKVVKALKVRLTPEQLQTMPLGYYYYYGYTGGLNIGQSFTTALNSSVGSAVSAANPTSVSGGSGGFSGGSSGGFGGGSGGGTF
ncbi:DUF2207 domain-containing protein [Lactobacillus curvatus]|nr:DUF2207 domain-containing protein [Latilactobacillus curvatus]MSE23156.1 DUF2207 domain-containing protein [Latilactobacillus curvatus]